ncbi:MAG TPA: hypothetical protein DDW49_03755 [Deltaproteobacteria bacterium]|nr:MAG: hypothetical protein A2048_00890 [Deltaproteobacteria bacterium GWA2_45_12]HBF12495.1 hypothetical protein [Deltaproteobacteria bacterium]
MSTPGQALAPSFRGKPRYKVLDIDPETNVKTEAGKIPLNPPFLKGESTVEKKGKLDAPA